MSAIIQGAGRPTRYVTSGGQRVPGVTTITGRFKDAGALIAWAHRQGMDGIPLDKARDEAASAGHIAHDHIEATIHGREWLEPFADPEVLERAASAHAQFTRWFAGSRIVITHTEVPLVSDAHGFGGTLDALGTLDDAPVLVDWKSSNGVYPEYIMQLGGYSILVRECLGITITEAHLARFAKDCDAFSHHSWGKAIIDTAEQAFLCALRLYEYDKLLKKAAK